MVSKSGGNALVTSVVGPEFAELAARLRSADKEIKTALRTGVRNAGKPLVNELKQAVMALDSKAYSSGGRRQRGKYYAKKSKSGRSRRDTGLRSNVARGVKLKVSLGANPKVTVWQDPSVLPPGSRNLPVNMDKGKWRHPVFGDRDAWVTQTVEPGWFTKTANTYGPDAYKAMVDVATELTDKLEG